jgi:hypothetical protein
MIKMLSYKSKYVQPPNKETKAMQKQAQPENTRGLEYVFQRLPRIPTIYILGTDIKR